MTTIKITALTDIGANIPNTTLIPVVDMTGTPTTDKATFGNVANAILSQAGNNYSAAAKAINVTASAQPNITSVGTLTALTVTGNVTANIYFGDGGFLSNVTGGNAVPSGSNSQVQYNDNGAFGGDPGMTYNEGTSTLTANNFVATSRANLGAVGNVTITGGSNGQVLTTNGSNVLSWTTVSGGNGSYSDSNVVTLLSAFGSNSISTTGNIGGGNLSTGGQVVASGNISSGTGLSTGGFLSVNGTADLHDTTVTGYANITGTANVVGGGATVGVRSILAIDSAFGSNDANDPASAQAVRGRVTGANLTKTRNYVAGVTGQYLVTGTNASEFINTGLLGVVGDQTTTANAAVVAYLDGDGGLTTAGSAYGVSMKNSTPGSGFDYGLDLQFIDLNVAGTTTPFKQADIRFNNGVELVANAANNISINANVTVGNITATNIGNIATLNLDGNASNVLRGDGTFSADANSSYGDSNVVSLLSAFGSNTIVTTGIITADGANLSNVPYANLTNAPSLGNISNINLDGNVSNLLTGNGTYVAIPVVPTVGNIANINLDGSNANVLYGNGVFAPVSGAGGLPLANGNSNFNIANANGNATVTTAGTQTWTFDTTGNVTIPGSIIGTTTIEIDNRASGNGADINLYSADDITLQARDRAIGSTSEGGDINIFAGDSAEDSDTSAGDIVIEAGRGGASNIDYGGTGGFVSVSAGRGGNAVGANFAARPGGSLTLNAGDAGANNGNIDLGNTGGDVTINAGDTTSNGDSGGSIILRSGDAGANALAGQVQIIIPSSDEGNGGTWTFNGSGILELPNSGTIGNEGNNIDIGSTSAISLEASSAVNIYTDTNGNAWQWQFQDDGNLRLPTIELDVGNTINEQTVIQSQRKIIPGLRYSAEINGTTPTVVYTATSVDTTSMKVTMQIQHTGLGFEFFDVSATSTGGNTYYTVSNRVQPPTISNSTVVVDLNGSNTMDITVTINSGAANSWVTYDATEFGIAVD